MEEKLIEFVNLLRRAGIPVSPAETIDALQSITFTDLTKETLADTLQATLIKNPVHEKVFAKLFRHYFNADGPMHNSNDGKISFFDLSGDGDGSPFGETGRKVAQFAREGNITAFRQLVLATIEALQLDSLDHINLRELERKIKIDLEWKIAEDILARDDSSADAAKEHLGQFADITEHQLEQCLLGKDGVVALDAIIKYENIGEVDFYDLSENQVKEMKKVIAKLGRKLSTRLSYRYKKSRSGRIDLRGTIKKAASTGGIPLKQAFKKRSHDRPEFAVFCDISGSVARFSQFMLQLVYAVQQKYINVRSFIFVDRVEEITHLFKEKELEQVLAKMYNSTTSSKTVYSNYGTVWQDVEQRIVTALSPKTTILILGDARNNYHRNNLSVFKQISARVKKMVWLNPEPLSRWNTEDSIMDIYACSCDFVYECRNLQQLKKVVEEIF